MVVNARMASIRLWTCLAAAILLLFAVPCSGADPSEISVGNGMLCLDTPQFALCTNAPCKVDESDPNTWICDCGIESGANWGQKTTCADRAAKLISTFSPIQAGPPLHLKSLVCDHNKWAVCLDAPCTADPNDPKKATCKCPVTNATPWQTFGGNCDPAACDKLWSAGPVGDEGIKDALEAFSRLGTPGADLPMCNGK